jgi:4-alpha-glucanotransferase
VVRADFFDAQQALGGLPLLAEDLGIITPAVTALRERFQLPGMRVLQFAFNGDPTNPHLPHHCVHNSVVYTGTHDNDTTAVVRHVAGHGAPSVERLHALRRTTGDVG